MSSSNTAKWKDIANRGDLTSPSSSAAAETPLSMKCIHGSSHGDDIDALISMARTSNPVLRRKDEILVRVQACSLAPGDVRVLKGHCDFFQEPPGGFPYIPGGDLAGVVVEAHEESRFKPGDSVIAMFDLPRPYGALAEYAVVKEISAEFAPSKLGPVEACCLTSSAVSALCATKRYVKPGDRILVLGGAGGVGSLFVQLAKLHGASFIAATTTTKASFRQSLGVDRVIDYRKDNWWDQDEFRSCPFDLILDAVGGHVSWDRAMNSGVLKNGWKGGRYIAMIGDEPHMQIHSLWEALVFMAKIQGRCWWSACWWFVPKYICGVLDIQAAPLAELVSLVDAEKLQVVLDPVSPLPFTADGVKQGFVVMDRRHAHGKVVVRVSE